MVFHKFCVPSKTEYKDNAQICTARFNNFVFLFPIRLNRSLANYQLALNQHTGNAMPNRFLWGISTGLRSLNAE